ncbi:hypothetical protein O181_040733 [Austropuccinia psidii MF-1]|uniref:Retrovirus-related Pol polyprotein from transposon TNT 1-94-like beta-barrel domain-containing protein n=1 Tax=Austropuccinia psidii MF-1 TaxID=1389203 RepID=A0A9Q3DFZ1_9BASI|nr:hypothetical protein [Austropuccinia psidii MF-1]
MDSRMTTDPNFQIRANEVLQVAQCFQKRLAPGNTSANNLISIMAASGSGQSPTPPFNQNTMPSRQRPLATRIPLSQQSESWACYHLSPKFPCLHCYQWGHWAQDCQRKKRGLPAIDDLQKKNPNVTLRKSMVFSHPCIAEIEVEEEDPFIASIQEEPPDNFLVLLDFGATHHVAGDISLFENYQKVDMSLSVASAKRHPVIGRGTINLACQSGKI